MLEVIALVGQPNVGKSTLFNRIAGSRIAIVGDTPGVTRDRVSANAMWNDRQFLLVDTGGVNLDNTEPLWDDVRRQTESALEHCHKVVLVTDAKCGVTPADREAAQLVRKSGKPAVIAANKAENRTLQESSSEFHSLGFDTVIPISALHGIGIDALVTQVLGADATADEPPDALAGSIGVAIVGKPNVGKSKIFNAVINEERAIVSPIAGTTRDAIDTHYSYGDINFTFIDTAGMRRRGKVAPGIEQYSVLRTIAAIERADLCMLLIGADEMVTAQDTHIAGHIKDSGRACVVVANKWDLADSETTRAKAVDEIRDRLNFLPTPHIVFTNARKLRSKDAAELLQKLSETHAQFQKTVRPYELSKALASALAHKMPPSRRGVFPQFGRIKQVAVAPPRFEIEAENAEYVHFSYRRYLENRLRDEFGFHGSPIIINFRKIA